MWMIQSFLNSENDSNDMKKVHLIDEFDSTAPGTCMYRRVYFEALNLIAQATCIKYCFSQPGYIHVVHIAAWEIC